MRRADAAIESRSVCAIPKTRAQGSRAVCAFTLEPELCGLAIVLTCQVSIATTGKIGMTRDNQQVRVGRAARPTVSDPKSYG